MADTRIGEDYTLRSRKCLRKVSRFARQCLKWCFLLAFCVLVYAKSIEPNWIEINSLQLTLPHLASEFNGYRIVQISDIHRDRWMNSQRLQHIVSLVNQQKPDLVVITGDLITRNLPELIPSLGNTLSQLQPKDQTLMILGNHDHQNDAKTIIQTLTKQGIVYIGNIVCTLHRGNGMLHIAGIDDLVAGTPNFDLVLQQLPQSGAAILLVHEPDFADTSAITDRFDLQLSGHSHGGQVRLPWFKPPVLPFWGVKYYAGLYQIGNMMEYTNRGLGMTGLHLRFGARPEITVFNLMAAK